MESNFDFQCAVNLHKSEIILRNCKRYGDNALLALHLPC